VGDEPEVRHDAADHERGHCDRVGPTGFAPDERRARVYAHVAGQSVQSGATNWFPADSTTWRRCHRAIAPARPGDAHGVAYVQNKDGTFEWYPWEVAVTLAR
jgi:hypothetical protein